MCDAHQVCDKYAKRHTVGQKNKGGSLKNSLIRRFVFLDGYFSFPQHYVIFTIEHFIPYF